MSRARGPRFTTLALVMLGLACGDAPSAPATSPETVVVSLAGVGEDDAGVVLTLAGDVEEVQSARPALEIAWARDDIGAVTVAIIGPLAGGGDLLLVRRRAGLEPLRVQVREVAGPDGTLSAPSAAQVTVRTAPAS